MSGVSLMASGVIANYLIDQNYAEARFSNRIGVLDVFGLLQH